MHHVDDDFAIKCGVPIATMIGYDLALSKMTRGLGKTDYAFIGYHRRRQEPELPPILQHAEIPLIDRGFVRAHPTSAADCKHVPRALTKSPKRSRFARSELDLGRHHRSCWKNLAYLRNLVPVGLSTR